MLISALRFAPRSALLGLTLVACGAGAATLHAQSAGPAVFAANNGNLEGSVSSFTVGPDGALTLVQRLVIGTTPSTAQPVPGTNAYTMTVSPDGRFLATTHATAAEVVEQVTILRVHADATLTLAGIFQTPNSPLGCRWVTDELLAITRTALSGSNHLILYRYDREANTLVEVDREPVPGFCTWIAVHPSRTIVYTQETTTNTIYSFRLNALGRLDPAGAASSSPYYPLGIGVTPDGRFLFSAGGISGGRSYISGFTIDNDPGSPTFGALAPSLFNPFIPGGNSPKLCVASTDSRHLFVGHGTDATLRVMTIGDDGVPTATPYMFDVGIQGSLGDIAVLPGLVFVSDNWTATDNLAGVYSFRVGTDGALTPSGSIVNSGANQPSALAAWMPPAASCVPDFDGDGTLDADDLSDFITCFFAAVASPGACPAADFNRRDGVDADDLSDYITAYFIGCEP